MNKKNHPEQCYLCSDDHEKIDYRQGAPLAGGVANQTVRNVILLNLTARGCRIGV